jgi:cell wall-associated NlpC family hydrolase
VFDEREGWAWVQLDADGYVGYVSADALVYNVVAVTHRVAVPATFIYPQPGLKSQPAEALTLNAGVSVAGQDGDYARVAGGRFVFRGHLRALADHESDFVAVAGRFLHVPYYWGGKSVRGLDCSGLVQLALEACGRACPRDSDMQEAELGEAVPAADLGRLQRGDLVFWDGHVGIMTDGVTLLHANGFHMMVVEEPLAAAAARIAGQGKSITAIRRLGS